MEVAMVLAVLISRQILRAVLYFGKFGKDDVQHCSSW